MALQGENGGYRSYRDHRDMTLNELLYEHYTSGEIDEIDEFDELKLSNTFKFTPDTSEQLYTLYNVFEKLETELLHTPDTSDMLDNSEDVFQWIFNVSNTPLEESQELQDTENSNKQFITRRNAKQPVPYNIKETEEYIIRRIKNTKCAKKIRDANKKQHKESINELIKLKKINANLRTERDRLIKKIKNQQFIKFIQQHTTYNVLGKIIN